MAIAAGLLAQNDAVTVLGRAIVVLVVCRGVGGAMGWVATRIASDVLQCESATIAAAASPVSESVVLEALGEAGGKAQENRRAA